MKSTVANITWHPSPGKVIMFLVASIFCAAAIGIVVGVSIADSRSKVKNGSESKPVSLAAGGSSYELQKGHWQSDHKNHAEHFGDVFQEVKDFGWPSDSVMPRLKERYPDGARYPERDVYQFGVYLGGSMREINRSFKEADIQFGNFWGFDSFQGLPEEDPEVSAKIGGGCSVFGEKICNKGAFSSADAMKVYDYPTLIQSIKNVVSRERTGFVRGFFNDSLTKTILSELPLQPALFVDVDVDLYISTYQAMEWMLCSGLIIEGTIVRYDDWGAAPLWEGGQSLAHKQYTERHSVEWKELKYESIRQGQAVYEVVSVQPAQDCWS
ncbi:hypothetical protein CYMTET_38727 [Cymbomonas tetramitiformis]|uniref:Uncharacterized protein n=1 Tax=Cymbomonas tetramitiformis TaxID=36881 RepID=A0AAE0CBG1_9CHLO|nr:hypothetical protein CYMTET_38728 [Cymbomonas tetramitiformis]KAK3251957.1 hypothetical protein CYMTET_38727 [Cymbomonas tetramitiformis]